jgi:hypothetical protein
MLILFWDGILGIHQTVGECQLVPFDVLLRGIFTYVTEYRILVYVCRQEVFSL